jgi:hypothetical protein
MSTYICLSEEQFPPDDAARKRRMIRAAEVDCGIHSPDCKHCNARGTCGSEMVKRLEELNRRTPPHSLKDGNHGEVLEDGDTKPPNCSKSA